MSRVLVALGVGTVTYVGLSAAVNSALGSAKSAFGQLGAEVFQLVAMAGVFQAMSIMAGGIIAGVSFMALKNLAMKATG